MTDIAQNTKDNIDWTGPSWVNRPVRQEQYSKKSGMEKEGAHDVPYRDTGDAEEELRVLCYDGTCRC